MNRPIARVTPGIDARFLIIVVGALFTVSGASGLVVEQVFEKLLTTVVGSATQSGAIVLSVFFAGLCLGGASYGRLRDRVGNPFYLYAWLEVCVAASALVLTVFMSPIQTFSSRIVHLAGDDGVRVLLARVLVACAWMLPPTMAMGATYPCIVRIVALAAPSRVPRTMARFYTLNLVGAVVSASLGPYVLFPRFGLSGVLVATGIVQLAVSTAAALLGRSYARRVRDDAAVAPERSAPPSNEVRLSSIFRERGVVLLVSGALLSGFVVFALEVLWFHLIGVVLGMSAYAFALMLAVVLAGLLIGSSVVGFLPEGTRVGDLVLPAALFASALALSVSSSLWDDVPRWLSECAVGFSDFPCGGAAIDFWSAERVRLRIAIFLVGIPSVFLGMVYPALFRTSIYPTKIADSVAGLLGATNAIGSIGGALVCSFVLIPRLGSENAYRWLSVSPAVFGLLGVLVLPFSPRVRAGLVAGAVAMTLFVMRTGDAWNRLELTSGMHVYLGRHHVFRDSRLRFWHEDSSGGIVTVVERSYGPAVVKTLLTNGKFQGNDAGETDAQVGFALLPALATSHRDRALVVGFGTGHSAAILRGTGFRYLDVAEISHGIVDAANAHFEPLHHRVLEQPGVTLFLEDARNHLLRTNESYDVISMELSSVWFAGVNNLYSREYYELAKRKLREGGVLQQWIQLHHLDKAEIASVLMTTHAVFPHVRLYSVGRQGIILASESPIQLASIDAAPMSNELAPELARWLRSLPSYDPDALSRMLVLSEADIESLAQWARAQGVPLTTDANRYLEYTSPRHALDRSLTSEKMLLNLLSHVPEPARTERRRALALESSASP